MTLNLTESSLNRHEFYDITCEEAVLGAFINEFRGCQESFDKIIADNFFDLNNKALWQIIESLHKTAKNVDIVSIGKQIPPSKSDLLSCLFRCSKRSGTSYGIEERISILKELYDRRVVKNLLSLANHKLLSTTQPASDIALEAASKLLKVEGFEQDPDSDARVIAEGISNQVTTDDFKLLPGSVPSYIKELDDIIHCFMPGELIILAGRPGMGKTALALSIARSAYHNGHNPFIQSIEMPTKQLVSRLLSIETGIAVDRILKGQLHEYDRKTVRDKWFEVPNIIINDSGRMTDGTMRSKILRLKERQNVGIVFIDYLQLMKSSAKTDNREREISEISATIKATAKEADIPIILLSQLSRESEKRPNKIPILSDLRESGSIEQDADMVLFTYRPEYYKIYEDSKGENLRGLGQVIIAKNRNGSLGEAVMKFESKTTHWKTRQETEEKPVILF